MSKLKWTKRGYIVFILFAATAIALPAQTFTTVFSFKGLDGYNPDATLVQPTNGNLYGTALAGRNVGYGTVETVPFRYHFQLSR